MILANLVFLAILVILVNIVILVDLVNLMVPTLELIALALVPTVLINILDTLINILLLDKI